MNATHCIATHCNTLQHAATCCNTLQHTCNWFQQASEECNTLQHTATHCNTLQHTVTHWSTLKPTATHLQLVQTCLGRMQRSKQLKIASCLSFHTHTPPPLLCPSPHCPFYHPPSTSSVIQGVRIVVSFSIVPVAAGRFLKFSKVSSIVILYSTFITQLTYEKSVVLMDDFERHNAT